MQLPQPVLRPLVRFWAARRGADVRYEGETIRVTRDDRTVVLRRSHLPYVREVVRWFDTFWGAVYDHGGVVDYSAPALHQYRDTGLAFWLPSMPEEPEAIRGYFHHGAPAPGALVFDLGAHSGVATYAFAQAVGETGRVIAFEPDPGAFTLLERNIALHGMRNVTAVPMAVAGATGIRPFNSEASLGSAFADMLNRYGTVATIDVECLTFADACAQYGVPSFVKIDIEGAEVEVLTSSVEFLRAHPEIARIAVDTNHPLPPGGPLTSARVEALLRAAGFTAETSDRYGMPMTWGHR